LPAFAASFRRSLRVVGKVAAATTLATLLTALLVIGALLARAVHSSATLLVATHVVILVALLSSPFVLLAVSTLVCHSFSPW
jgi:hypothetical protein